MKTIQFIFLLFILSLFAISVKSQAPCESGRVNVYLWIVSSTDSIVVPFAHAVVPVRNIGTAADRYGNLRISVCKDDSIRISSVGYKEKWINFHGYTGQEFNGIITLEPFIGQLPMANILPYKTYAQFKTAVIAYKLPDNPYEEVQIRLDNIIQEAKGEAGMDKLASGSGFIQIAPITMLYNQFSHKGKVEREYLRLLKEDNYREFIDAKYNEEMVTAMTGIKDSVALKSFMEFCHLADSFVELASEYQIYCAIAECYDEFLVRKQDSAE